MTRVDLNSDLGEGVGHDAELMPLITSANIACGAHAGDAVTMRETMALASRHGVGVGAHPGFDDREHFGRREISMSPAGLRELVVRQIALLREMGPVRHVKPHGALYNLAAGNRTIADLIASAVWEVDRSLVLFGLAGSELVHAGKSRGLTVAQETFGDRTYQPNGSLTPRTQAGAVIENESAVVSQVLQMVRMGTVRATDGTDVKITADTICLHGDGPNAVGFARLLRAELAAEGITVRAFGLP
jgi:UPF0271 protein